LRNDFIDFLKSLQSEIVFKSNISDYELGKRCATGCINDIIDTRMGLFLKETEQVDECQVFIEDCIENTLWVINASLEDKIIDDDFNRGYKEKTSEIIKELKNYRPNKDT
jgi:hypothetical protein